MNIAGELQEIAVGIKQKRFVSPLEKVTGLLSSAIDVSGIPEGEVLNNSGKRNIASLNDQVDMIGHQAIGMNTMPESFCSLLEQQEKSAAVMIIEKNRVSCIAPEDDVIKSAWIMNSRFASHAL